MALNKKKIFKWLEEVKDPEIPVLSLVDLGVITDVDIDDNHVRVKMTPTFAGCPAIDYMKTDVIKVLKQKGVESVECQITFEKQWNSNMISEKGRKALKEFGLAPPPKHNRVIDLDILERIKCPYCGSKETELRNSFGPTLCRSIHYCNSCNQAFEQFKPV